MAMGTRVKIIETQKLRERSQDPRPWASEVSTLAGCAGISEMASDEVGFTNNKENTYSPELLPQEQSAAAQ